MINEQDKQAILNGSFGVSRDGCKCKLVGITTSSTFKYFFVYFNEEGLVISHNYLNENFHEYKDTSSKYDVIGIWKDEPEPFNLEKALQGEPVKLRDGSKAYVKYIMPSEHGELYPVHGYFFDPDEPTDVEIEQWTAEGKAYIPDPNSDSDIISMWEDPEPNRVTLTLPCPLKEPKEPMWFINKSGIFPSNYGKNIPEYTFLSRPYFGSEQDAKAWWEAMMNSRT